MDTVTGLLILRDRIRDPADVQHLVAVLNAFGFERGHLVGPVLPVTGESEQMLALSQHVEAAVAGLRPTGANVVLLDALAPCVASFAWDEGAETF